MKALKTKIAYCIILALAGAALLAVSIFYHDPNGGTLAGIAGGLLVVSLLKIVQFVRVMKNDALLKKFELNQQEERFIMLAEKSGRYTLMLSLSAALAAAIVLAVLDFGRTALLLCCIAAAQTLLYLIIFYALSKRY